MTIAVASIRREAVFLALERLGGWRAAREISELMERESLLPHAPLLAGDYVLPWTAYSDLCALERAGKVRRHRVTARTVWWRALPEEKHGHEALNRGAK